MFSFTRWLRKRSGRYLDPTDRLPEVVLGLILVVGVTGTLRVGISQGQFSIVDLFLTALGVNIAWGIVDAVMYATDSYFSRHRNASISEGLRKDPNNVRAREALENDLDGTIIHNLNKGDRERIRAILVNALPDVPDRRAFFKDFGDDLKGAFWIFAVVFVSMFPLLIPFVVFQHDPLLALNISTLITLVMLFGIGVVWAGYAGISRLKPGIGFLIIGTIITLVTYLLGG